MQYVAGAMKKFPDLQTRIEEIIPEDDRIVVRNRWTATSSQTGKRWSFVGSSFGVSPPANSPSAGRFSNRPTRRSLSFRLTH
jgi:hypothetical protein